MVGKRRAAGYYVLGVWDDLERLTSHTLQFGGNYYVTPTVRIMKNLVVPVGQVQPRPRTRWWSRLQVVF